MKLSVLICTIPERKEKFDILLNKLQFLSINKDVEILCDNRARGTVTIGQKRNDLINKSTGDYISFVDDDDDISNNYFDLILNAIETDMLSKSILK